MSVPVIATGDVPAPAPGGRPRRMAYAVAMPAKGEVWLCWAEGHWLAAQVKLGIDDARATLAALRGAIETYETLTAAAEVVHG